MILEQILKFRKFFKIMILFRFSGLFFPLGKFSISFYVGMYLKMIIEGFLGIKNLFTVITLMHNIIEFSIN